MPDGSLRRLVAAAPPAAATLVAWTTLERDASARAFLAILIVSLATCLPTRPLARVGLGLALLAATAVVLVQQAPGGLSAVVSRGLSDAYAIAPPFRIAGHGELHALVALAAAAFAIAIALTAGSRAFAASAIAATGIGVAATLNPSRNTVAMGALGVTAALWPLAVAAMRDRDSFAPGLAVVAGVSVVAVVLAGAGARPSTAALDWENWDLFGQSHAGRTVSLIWRSDYGGIDFPPTTTTVLKIEAPRRALYWRATTLDTFVGDHWLEALYTTEPTDDRQLLPPDSLLPLAAASRASWVKQKVDVRALVDDHVVAASQPVAVDAGSDLKPRALSGGVLVRRDGSTSLRRYTVWSYAPDPTPAQLVRSKPVYPEEVLRFLDVGQTWTKPFGTPGRAARTAALFDNVRYPLLAPYAGMWFDARRLTRTAKTPFEATIAIERWLRTSGTFAYDQHPPPPNGLPPLADFEGQSKRGYCQHFAGTMALMLRYLGIPARVAVGFTSGRWKDGTWTVTDHDAHAWVEAWFAGYGWLPFDPTPGRGTLSATYTNASDSADAIRALGTGRFLGTDARGRTPTHRGVTTTDVAQGSARGTNWLAAAPALVLLAAIAALGGAKALRRRRRRAVRDPRGRASAARAELAAYLTDQGLGVTTAVPVPVLVTELRSLGVGADAFADAFSRARYGPPAGADAAAERARAELDKVVSVLRARLGLSRRLRGFLSLRSLRKA